MRACGRGAAGGCGPAGSEREACGEGNVSQPAHADNKYACALVGNLQPTRCPVHRARLPLPHTCDGLTTRSVPSPGRGRVAGLEPTGNSRVLHHPSKTDDGVERRAGLSVKTTPHVTCRRGRVPRLGWRCPRQLARAAGGSDNLVPSVYVSPGLSNSAETCRFPGAPAG